MSRFFLEVAYKGSNYSGFQAQHNANTIQAEIEKAICVLFGRLRGAGEEQVKLTGSSRTDAGVHALQNFFHFDTERQPGAEFTYKMNAMLPEDIVVKRLIPVVKDAHCRFDAISREYRYYIYREKNPFLRERAFYFPYKVDVDLMKGAAEIVKGYSDFTSFSKRNTQVKSFHCVILESDWHREKDCLVYHVKANRFLRGMVRALTATMLLIGRGRISLDQFRGIIEARDCTKSSFAVPSRGLFLVSVDYPPSVFGE